MNWLSTEIAAKHGPEAVYCKDWMWDKDVTPQCITDYVVIPFVMTYTEKEARVVQKALNLKYPPTSDPLGNGIVKMDILRERVIADFKKGKFKTNARSMTEKWSKDGKHVYLFSGIAKDTPYMSWSCQLAVAYNFAVEDGCIGLEGHKKDEMEVRIMKVPLDLIDEFTYWAVHQASEVMVDIDHPTFKKLYADSYGITPAEAKALDAEYYDARYDFNFGFPTPLLCDWNRYPYNLIYMPYEMPSGFKMDGD